MTRFGWFLAGVAVGGIGVGVLLALGSYVFVHLMLRVIFE